MAKSVAANSKEKDSSLERFSKFIKSKRFKNFCEDNYSFRNFDRDNADDLLALKHHIDETLSWKKPAPDVKNKVYLQHIIGSMVEAYVNECDLAPKGRRTHEQPTKNVYSPLPRIDTSSKDFYKKLNSPISRRG